MLGVSSREAERHLVLSYWRDIQQLTRRQSRLMNSRSGYGKNVCITFLLYFWFWGYTSILIKHTFCCFERLPYTYLKLCSCWLCNFRLPSMPCYTNVWHVLSLQYMSYLPLIGRSLPRVLHSGVSRVRSCLENGGWGKRTIHKRKKNYGWMDERMAESMMEDASFRFRVVRLCQGAVIGLTSLWSGKQEIGGMLWWMAWLWYE